ncbi:MAG: hypothetical protein ACK43M_22400 [Allorhizobium sp.]
MTVELDFDTSEITQLTRAFHGLPGEIKTKVMARAMRRMRDRARTEIVNRTTKRLSVPRSEVHKITTARFNAGSNTIEVLEKSGWIAIYKLGARQTRSGVTTRLRGSYKHAFIATMINKRKDGGAASGHTGVFSNHGGYNRKSERKNAVHELFGPNPAHDVTNNPEEYLNILAEIIQKELAPRMMHELERLLSQK